MGTPATYCAICDKRCPVDPFIYSPPAHKRHLIDEAYFSYKHGWLCTNCIPKVQWDSLDQKRLKEDWGIEVKTPI